MEMKQKRGWLRFALTTAIALAFMLSLSVTAMARGITLVPVASDDNHLVIDVVVDAGADGLTELDVRLAWDESVLQLVRPTATTWVQLFPTSTELETELIMLNAQPTVGSVEAGDIRMVFMPSSYSIDVLGPPLRNETGERPWARLRFNLVNETAIAAGDSTVISMEFNVASYEAATGRTEQVIYPMPSNSYTGLRIIWGVYGDAPLVAFVDAITGTHAAWWQFWYAARGYVIAGGTASPTVEQVNEAIAFWAAASAS